MRLAVVILAAIAVLWCTIALIVNIVAGSVLWSILLGACVLFDLVILIAELRT